jgi:hypothetical protein
VTTTSALPRPEDPHTIEQAAAALDVPAVTIRMWKSRGRVMPCDYLAERVRGDGRRPLFLLDELRPRAEAYHRRRAQRNPDTSAPS